MSVGTSDPPYARREIIRLLGCCAATHGASIKPSIQKIVNYLITRFKDNDTGIRDAAAETFGFISKYSLASTEMNSSWPPVPPPPPRFGQPDAKMQYPLSILLNPLLITLEEEKFPPLLQGAAQAVEAVIEGAHPVLVERAWMVMGLRWTRLFTRPTCPMASQLLHTIPALCTSIPVAILPILPVLLQISAEFFSHKDWIVRRTAVECILSSIAAYQALLLGLADSETPPLPSSSSSSPLPPDMSVLPPSSDSSVPSQFPPNPPLPIISFF